MELMMQACNQGEDRVYLIVERVRDPGPGVHPLMRFGHDPHSVPVSALSVEELKAKLRAMLEACDAPPLVLLPARLSAPAGGKPA